MKNHASHHSRAFLVAAFLAGSATGLLNEYSVLTAMAADPTLMAPAVPAKVTGPGSEPFSGLQPGLGSLPLLGRGRTRSISAENPTGEKGKGGMAISHPTEAKPAASARAADNLGQGWKVRPFIRLNAHETATLMDVAGSGVIQHFWLVEGLNRGLVLRVTIQALGWGTDGKYKKLADDIASVAYWYQAEPHASFPKLPALAERLREPSHPPTKP